MRQCSPCTKAGSWAKWRGSTEPRPRRAPRSRVPHGAGAQRPVSGLHNSHEIFRRKMKPIKKTKPREGLAPGPSGGRGWLVFSIHELGTEIRKARTIYSKHDHSGL